MEDCTVTTETINGVHHTFYSKDGAIIAEYRKLTGHEHSYEKWLRDGKYHRADGPAVIRYKNGQIIEESWYYHGKRHRVDGPAEIRYENGQLYSEDWYRDGKQHRVDGPADIWYENGKIYREIWYQDGKSHRVDGPAKIWYKNGQITEERWHRNDELCPTGVLASVIAHPTIDSITKYYCDSHEIIQDINEFRDSVKGDAIHDALRALPIPIRQAIAAHYCYQ